ncbi:MAG: hypothetical protein C4K49_08040 [Candidatus Thorarchaeota archaeon]|nr:MAG: hypothetical protein C4K49_08040 [Candidatus Thorarchaeota archaeon]
MKSVPEVARRIHNIQIDTISVVARSHDLIVYNRLGRYKTGRVWDWLKRGRLFEYWSHAMCLLPIETYSYYAWTMKDTPKAVWSTIHEWASNHKDAIDAVYSKVKADGPTSTSDFEKSDKRRGTWWDWSTEKTALEYLFYVGRLMICHRENFQRFYDLTERVLPKDVAPEPMPEQEVPLFVVSTVLSSLGVAGAEDIRLYLGRFPCRALWKGKKSEIEKYLDELQREGVVDDLALEGIKGRFFVLTKDTREMEKCAEPGTDNVPVKLLSPFDNVVRERHLPRTLWGFDYAMESYTPPEKRVYGYYVLPILDGYRLVGRTDVKVYREEGVLELKSIYLDPDVANQREFQDRLTAGVRAFSEFHECVRVRTGKVVPKRETKAIERVLTL